MYKTNTNHHISCHIKNTSFNLPHPIAIRNISHERPLHHKEFADLNKNWKIHYYDNEAKDKFMCDHFNGTSLLWAYNLLNPAIGCARAEIWRLAILYIHGGLYLDDDAMIYTPLDEIVKFNDKLLLGEDVGQYDDRCWKDVFPLSNKSLVTRFGISDGHESLFNNKWFFNWAMFSAPGHPVLRRVMKHIVTLIRAEYTTFSLIKMLNDDHRGKLLMCISTFPLTVTLREVILENKYDKNDLGVRTFTVRDYKCDMKAWNNDWAPDRWTKMIHNQRKEYLIEYESPGGDVCSTMLDGEIVQLGGHHEIFIILNGEKHSFENWDIFVKTQWDTDYIVTVSAKVLGKIPSGEPVNDDTKETYNRLKLLDNMEERKKKSFELFTSILEFDEDASHDATLYANITKN